MPKPLSIILQKIEKTENARNKESSVSFSSIEEEKIVRQAIKGEKEAFGLLYDKYQPQIYRFIYIKVGNRATAEDLTHEVFLKSWKKISDYRIREFPFSSWLYRIARNEVIDYYRLQKNNLSLEEIFDKDKENNVIPDQTQSPLDSTEKNIKKEKLMQAIQKLNPIEQDIIILKFIEDLSTQKIAENLGKTNLAVRLIQHRAIKKLKKYLNA
jgi:RNA polymerase sigma-70 factor (ECF subfamily)